MRFIGNNRAKDAADDQCADPLSAVHAAVVVMVAVMRRWRCGAMMKDGLTAMDDGAAPVHHGTAVIDGSAPVHHGTAVIDGSAPVHRGTAVIDGSAPVHRGTAVMNGPAFMHHGLYLVTRAAFVHAVTLMGRCAFMNGRPCLVAGTMLLHRGFHLMDGGTSLCFPLDLPGMRRGSAAAIMTG